MPNKYSEILESYLIPANEALDSESKGKLAEIGIMAAIVAALGISQHFKNRKKEKAEKEKISNNLKERAKKN